MKSSIRKREEQQRAYRKKVLEVCRRWRPSLAAKKRKIKHGG